MKQKIFIVALILGLIVIALLYTLNFNLDSEMEIGNDYKVNYDIYANNEPMFNGGDYPEFSLKINDLVELVEIEGDFAKIKHQEKEGWIPVWYILEESAQIDESASYLRIIDKEASIYLLPIENSPSYSDDYQLEKGKVIKIFATYGDWYCIDFIRYDNPEFDLTWIKKDYTSEYDKSLVKEAGESK